MRKTTMIATEGHFLFIAKTTRKKDLQYEAHDKPNGNPIGFFVSGTSNTFTADSDFNWSPYSSTSAPILHTRSCHSLFGAVATSDETLYVSIIPREGSVEGTWASLNNATTDELDKLKTTKTSFVLELDCSSNIFKDLNTFETIPESEAINIIDENEITFDFNGV